MVRFAEMILCYFHSDRFVYHQFSIRTFIVSSSCDCLFRTINSFGKFLCIQSTQKPKYWWTKLSFQLTEGFPHFFNYFISFSVFVLIAGNQHWIDSAYTFIFYAAETFGATTFFVTLLFIESNWSACVCSEPEINRQDGRGQDQLTGIEYRLSSLSVFYRYWYHQSEIRKKKQSHDRN